MPQGTSDNSCGYTDHMQIISKAVREWDSAFISFTKSCKHLYESRKENNLLVDVQPCFSLPILNELIETRLSISMKLAVGKYQEKSFDARDKFDHSTDHLFSALNSFAETVTNHYALNSRLPKVVPIQHILNVINSFKSMLADECDAIRLFHFKQIFNDSFNTNDKWTDYFLFSNSLIKRIWCNDFIVQLNTLLDFLI
ncbi:unnamed protein product [Schistosoma rodhaini]|nr:hypothetical protein Smp_065170 [Schistosoma mansoni]CAH8509787.1 unnamed protein product [Schistosoma rodhaini]|eukprot:XP_018650316.1 hypothetical protein Smp_065170 [Schistosoma mansoni]